MHALGQCKERPGAILGHLGAILGQLEAILAHFGAILRSSCSHLGAFVGHLGAIVGILGASVGQLGAILEHLGAMLEPSWAKKRCMKDVLRVLLSFVGSRLGSEPIFEGLPARFGRVRLEMLPSGRGGLTTSENGRPGREYRARTFDIPNTSRRPSNLCTRKVHRCHIWPGNHHFAQSCENIKNGLGQIGRSGQQGQIGRIG